jgi:uncharacterized protein YndB with AHSA1/START domain
MNNEAQGHFTEPGTIVFRRVLPGPIERVWEYLTDPEKRGKWLASGEMELVVGGKVELHFHHADLSPIPEEVPEKYCTPEGSVSFTGRVTRCEPPRVLAYTWAESRGEDSEVTFELSERDGKVELLLTHRRLGDDHDVLLSVAAGWHTHLGILVDRLAGTTPWPFWTTHEKHEADYTQALATTGRSQE